MRPSFLAVRGEQVCSVWLPLDPIPKETCLEFVAGSHRWNQTFAPIRFADGVPYEPVTLPLLPDVESERSSHNILSWEMRPGDCLVFHSRVLHRAPPNASKVLRRRAISTRWCGEHSMYAAPRGCVGVGYPNFEVPLSDGESMVCPAFPIVWPRDHPKRPAYDPEAPPLEDGDNELLPPVLATEYEKKRRAQARMYSLSASEDTQSGMNVH